MAPGTDFARLAIGTAHATVKCGWCARALVAADVSGLRCWVCPACYARQLAFALAVTDAATGKTTVHHVPLPSQVPIYEASRLGGYLLWGGHAGPGKSTGGRRVLYWRCLSTPGHQALLLRENWDQLRDNHTLKMAHEVPALGGKWMEGDRLARFGKGSDESVIHCGHMADVAALERYIGIEYGTILPDEASLYPVNHEGLPVLAELTRAARVHGVDRAGGPVPALFLPVTNPGGPSAPWLNDMFIEHTPDYEKAPRLRPVYDADGVQLSGYRPEQWRYVPAMAEANPYLPDDYVQTTLAVLGETRYRQLALGDWKAFAGQFFREWDEAHHVRQAVLA